MEEVDNHPPAQAAETGGRVHIIYNGVPTLPPSPEKSTVPLFTQDPHQTNIQPSVKVKNQPVKLDITPK